jgi:transcriptional regulator with XRE-family HTH domain
MADNLWALREQKKLSVATLASRAGLPIGLIMEYEAGQRSIDPRHLSRLARALYVEESDLRLQSDPRPGTGQLERQPRREEGRPASAPVNAPEGVAAPSGPAAAQPSAAAEPATPPTPRPRERTPRPPRSAGPPRPPAPARPSQIAHLKDMLVRLGRSEAALEVELGKPLAEIDRPTASKLLATFQTELRDGRTAERHRAYLPEAVDQFEQRYLLAAQEAAAPLRFTLFDGSLVTGQLIGFGAYNVTLRQDDGNEITLNKLAVVSYARPAEAGASANGTEPHS